ncbi:MAG: hypothetical protein FJ109_17105, partial [Deltaproteobacteria bacterium]|nr:hypothetical protein [Deltaproteobacteria bacterium]
MKTFVRLAMIASAGALFLAGIGCGGGEEEGRDVAGEDAGTGDVETAPDQSVAPDETPESDVQVAPDETPEPDVQVAPDETPEPDVQVAPDETPEPDVKTCADQMCGQNAECDEA